MSSMDATPWRYADTYQWMERVQRGLGPTIITCAVNGGVQGREAHPALPETPEEIADQVAEAYDAGASVVHIHGRSPDALWDAASSAEVYFEINRLVRERCPDIVINNTTGGGPSTTMEDRLRCLDARPEMASLNLGPDMSRFRIKPRPEPLPHPHDGFDIDVCVPFTYGIIEDLATAMAERNIKPELETYHSGQYWVSRGLIERGLLQRPYVHQFVMAYQTSAYPTPGNVLHLLEELAEGSLFFCAGIGVFQHPMNATAILLGGHVRVGLEDNLNYRRGQKFTGNGEAVTRVARLIEELQRPVATPAEARALLGIDATPSRY